MGWFLLLVRSYGGPYRLLRRGLRIAQSEGYANALRRLTTLGAGQGPLADALDDGVAGTKSLASDAEPRWRIELLGDVSGRDVVLLTMYSPVGNLSTLQESLLKEWTSAGYAVCLIINTDRFDSACDTREQSSTIRVVRENVGFDFAAWRTALTQIPSLMLAASLLYSNDSLTFCNDGVASLRERLSAARAPVVFGTISHEVYPHGQSYLFTARDSVAAEALRETLLALPRYSEKRAAVHGGEVLLTKRLIARGLEIGALYTVPEESAAERNPTLHDWRALLDAGCPYLKLQLFSLGIASAFDPRVTAFLGVGAASQIEEHLRERGGARPNHA